MTASAVTPPAAGLEPIVWRALAGYRTASLGYALALAYRNAPHYEHRTTGLAVVAAVLAWTVAAVPAYLRRPGRVFLGADLVVTTALLLATLAVESDARLDAGAPSLTTVWGAGPVLAWAAIGGPWAGLAAAAWVSAATVAVRAALTQSTLENVVLLVLAGTVVGYVVRLARRTEALVARMLSRQAATAERERLARRIHDGVLQVLALVERTGDPELGALAAEQEVALRALVSSPAVDLEAGALDLRTLLTPLARTGVSLSSPGSPVPMPAAAARELAAAVAAALSNVATHVGPDAPAWVLVEDEGVQVVVTVRDEGPGFSEDRLATAEADGRLGVAQSMRGRIRDLGGTTVLHSAPGQGTEVEFRVPR